jgi:hypothetical protein
MIMICRRCGLGERAGVAASTCKQNATQRVTCPEQVQARSISSRIGLCCSLCCTPLPPIHMSKSLVPFFRGWC